MGLTVLSIDQNNEWDAIVKSFKNYDIYWLSGYSRAFMVHGDGIPLLFYYEDSKVRGINVVMKRDIANDTRFSNLIPYNTFFDFSTPYGYGGWIIEGDDSSSLFETYEKWCEDNNIISEFVRFHPVVENHHMNTGFYDITPLGNTITIDLSSPEMIWSNLSSKNRNVIRKAMKNGIQVFSGRNPDIYKEFHEIYNKTMDKDNANDYYYFHDEFYESILYDLRRNAQVFYAEYEKKVIAAAIMLYANGRINYHLSGSRQEYSSLAPTNLILYEAALWGCENGFKTLYLGGGVGSGEDSLFKFKKAFYRGEDDKRFYIGKKIYILDRYIEFVNIAGNIQNPSFFPQYRG